MPYTLWLRAGTDGICQSGDPSSHHLFMLMLYKASNDPNLQFDVRTVNESRPPDQFRQVGLRRAPALQIDDDTALSFEDDIIDHLELYKPKKQINQDAESQTADLFRQYAFFIKEINKDPKCLNTELHRIDELLSISGDYLAGSNITYIDCLVLPRLHSIRIASKALKDYDIPIELVHLWKYLERGYSSSFFTTSCPSDQEIIVHWMDRPDTPNLPSNQRAALIRQTPFFTTTIPSLP